MGYPPGSPRAGSCICPLLLFCFRRPAPPLPPSPRLLLLLLPFPRSPFLRGASRPGSAIFPGAVVDTQGADCPNEQNLPLCGLWLATLSRRAAPEELPMPMTGAAYLTEIGDP